MTTTTPSTDLRPATGARSTLAGLGIGAAGAVVGLAPWWLSGARLPLQNLWAVETLPQDMPVALLPVSQYATTTILAMLVVGGAVAGAASRLRRPAAPGADRPATWPVLAGVLLVHAVAIVQSFVVVARGLGLRGGVADERAALYLGGMLGGTVAVALLALGVGWLIAHRAVEAVTLGLGAVAVPLASWVLAWFGLLGGPAVPAFLPPVHRWLPAVVVGVALGWCGLRPARRVAVWAVDLALLWLVPAVLIAASYGLGMRVLDGDLHEMAAAALDLFPVVLREAVPPVGVALAIGLAIVAARAVAGGRTTAADVAPEPSPAPLD